MKELAFFVVGVLVATAVGHQKNKIKELERQLERQNQAAGNSASRNNNSNANQ